MMQKKWLVLLLPLMAFMGLLGCQNVSAWSNAKDNDFITYTSVDDHDTYDEDGETITDFDIDITFGSNCSGCVDMGDWRCNDPGDEETTCVDDEATKYRHDSDCDTDDYECYEVQYYPCNDYQQDFIGHVQKPKPQKPKQYRVKAWAVRTDGKYINKSTGAVGSTGAKALFYNKVKNEETKVEVTRKDLSGKGWKFDGWRKTKNSGSLTSGVKYTINSLSGATKLFAVYEPQSYKLTITTENATATVTRTSSPLKGASTGTLSNNATVYYGDVLKVDYGKGGCYSWDTHTVDGTSRSSDYSWTVTANTAVVAKANKISYKLTIDQGTGTSISVKQGNSSLSNGATIYCGDKLNATMSLTDTNKYEWVSHSFVGKDTNNTTNVSISNHVIGADVTVTTRAKLQKRTLTGVAVDTDGNVLDSGIKKIDFEPDNPKTVDYGTHAWVTRGTHDAYNFKGWKVAASASATKSAGFITDHNSNHAAYVSGSASPKETYNVKEITANGTVYAVYELKHYTLTVDKDSYSMITAYRTSSPYAGAGTCSKSRAGVWSCNTGGNLSSGGTIYYGDELMIKFGLTDSTCHPSALGTYTVKVGTGSAVAKTLDTEHTYTGSNAVKNDITVYARSPLKSYTLTKTQATGTTITVKRTSSNAKKDMQVGPSSSSITTLNRDASTGTLAGGATIYCGDKLTTTFSLNDGYSWGDYNWAGRSNDEKWGYHFKGNGIDETGPSDATDHTDKTYTDHEVKADVLAETQSVRDEFAGRITASGGIDTGWVETDQSKTSEIDCKNYIDGRSGDDEGCTATFQPSLKTIKGTGKVVYAVQRSKNGGTWTNVILSPASPLAPTTSGTDINKASGDYSEKLYPGESVCYKITFLPHVETTSKTLSACVTAKVSNFYDKSTVTSGRTTGNTDWLNATNTSSPKRVDISNCSPTSGCSVTFKHEMKRTNSIGSTVYSIARTSNLTSTSSTRKIDEGTVKSLTRLTPTSNDTAVKIRENTVTLYPGMVVCETVTFRPNNEVERTSSGRGVTYSEFKNANQSVKICASALGDAQPPDNPDPNNTPEDPGRDEKSSNDSSFINIKVRNKNVSNYAKYQREVYAKPGDTLSYRVTYNPVLQYTYYLEPENLSVSCYNTSNSLIKTVGPVGNSGEAQLGALYNQTAPYISRTKAGCGESLKAIIKNWNNDIYVYSSNFTAGTFAQAYNYTNGNMSKQIPTPNTHEVQDSEAGRSVNETAETNRSKADTRTTPRQVSFTNNSNKNLGTVNTSYKAQTAYARVPYNFENMTKVTTDTNTEVYAGETKAFNFDIYVNPRQNSVTDGNYATIVRGAKWKLELCYNNNTTCQETTPTSDASEASKHDGMNNQTHGDLNSGYSRSGRTEAGHNPENKTITVNIPDLVAGSDICIRSAVYPALSGAVDSRGNVTDAGNKNYTDAEGSHTWAWSARVCYKISKKPSLQVWGGNIYTSVSAETALSRKNHLDGYNNYRISTPNGNDYLFGSWGELGIVSGDDVKELSSGSTLGYATLGTNGMNTVKPKPYNGSSNNKYDNTRSNTGDNPGGMMVSAGGGSFCSTRVPLTFANTPCGSNTSGLGNSVAKESTSGDKESIAEQYMYKGDITATYVSGHYEANLANEDDKLRDDSVYYYYSGDNDMTLLGGQVRIGTTKVVHSEKDVTISGNITYEEGAGYTSFSNMPKLIVYAKNIKIDCGVSRIDGVLVAQDKVVTCNNFDGNIDDRNFARNVKSHLNDKQNSTQLIINGAVIANTLIPNRTYGAATGANSMVPAEIINYDPTLYQWGGQKMESEGVNINLDVTYSRELAPRL